MVASILSVGGPCKYVWKDGANLSDDWLCEYAVPHIAQKMSPGVAAVLGKAFMWACYEPSLSGFVPSVLSERLKQAYCNIPAGPCLRDRECPVKRVELIVTGHEGEVHIDELEDAAEENGATRTRAASSRELAAIYSKVVSLERRLIDSVNNQTRSYTDMTSYIRKIQSNIRRFANFPVRSIGATRRGTDEALRRERDGPTATLTKNPRDLYTLWKEYEFGVGGRKPARQFTSIERGKCKYTYSKRKVIWNVIDRMVRGGYTAQVACDRIYDIYGRLSLTKLVLEIRKDEKRGGHCSLR